MPLVSGSNPQDKKPENGEPGLGALSVLASVFRAWLGVQTDKNRQRDFSSKDPVPFIIAGVIFAVMMIIGVLIAVNIALSGAPK